MKERPKAVEILDKDGLYLMVFDNLSEEEAVAIMVKSLKNGIPEARKAKKLPDFLQKENIFE